MTALKLLLPTLCIVHTATASNTEIGIRKDVLDMSDDEKAAFLEALYKMKSTPSKYNSSFSSYDYYAWVHRYALENSHIGANGHQRWNFLPWHRGFAYLFEQELQEISNDASIRLPYWDLSNAASTNAALFDESFLGGAGDANRSHMLSNSTRLNCKDWPIDFRLIDGTHMENVSCLARSFGLFRESLPPEDEWEKVLYAGFEYDVEPYNDWIAAEQNLTQNMVVSFRARIEGLGGLICNVSGNTECKSLHNAIHAYIGGHIVTGAAPIDPLFILLHNWIDVMWALYQDLYGLEYTFPEQYKNYSYFDGWFNDSKMNSMDVMDVRELGYVYQIQARNTEDEGEWWTVERMLIVAAIAISAVLVLVVCVCCVWRAKKSATTDKYQHI